MKILFYIRIIISVAIFWVGLIIAFPIILALILLFGVKAGRSVHAIGVFLFRLLIKGFMVRVRQYNRDILDKSRSYIIVVNHRSMLDIPLCHSYIPMYFKFLAKESLKNMPLIGFIIRTMYLTVNQSSLRERAKSLIKIKQELKNNVSVLIYPEGSRNKTSTNILPLQNGAFSMAISMKVPIVVLTLSNTYDIYHKPKFIPVAHMYWEKVIETKDLTKNDTSKIRSEVYEIMNKRIDLLKGKK